MIIETKIKYFKSPMNYLGNKYKLLPQMLELFPENIDTFYDLFCGGLDVSLNINANKIIANDKHKDLIDLYKEIRNYTENLGDDIYELDKIYFPMNKYNGKSLGTYQRTGNKEIYKMLSEQKKKSYYTLRDSYNFSNDKDFKILLLLMHNSGGLVEFRVMDGTITFASGVGKLNERVRARLNEFPERLHDIEFINKDFKVFKSHIFTKNDFVYIDPPYLGTNQYKIKWNKDDEEYLYKFIDDLDKNNVKFALSNFEDGKNHTNEYLRKWYGKYNIHNLNDSHSILTGISKKGERQEILVTNY